MKIQVLDKHTAELIAAGEVVERPSSVIKELMENAIDASATAITVEIRSGGIALMRITDNGSGMVHEDVPTAFLRHATSKVRTQEDLDAIGTLGFRGEALASVAAVARIELLTRTSEETAGTRYCLEGGEETVFEEAGCPQGTTIVVRDLFYNVPARMKFLKKDVSEGNSVAGVVDRIALSHPEVAVRFIREGREELLTPGDNQLHSCIYAVFGKEFADGLLPVSYTLKGIHVHGYSSKPAAGRANRTMQHFFINGRYVKTRTGVAALEQAYKGVMMTGKFPACVLHVDMPAETVDANVHPAKIEVRFVQERPVFDAVYYGVQSALAQGDTRKQVILPQKLPTAAPPEVQQIRLPDPVVSVPNPAPKPLLLRDDSFLHTEYSISHIPVDIVRTTPSPLPSSPPPPPPSVLEVKEKSPVVYLGELLHTYLLAEMDGELHIIDKHAAHERILYDQLLKEPKNDAQLLLEPLSVMLGKEEYTALMQEGQELEQAGFEVEEFGAGTVLVRAIPMILTGCDVAAVIQEMAGGFAAGKREASCSKREWILHSTACRAAVKAGDSNSFEELRQLAERVLQSEDIRYCPHGRPVCISLTRKEIEKQFGRIV